MPAYNKQSGSKDVAFFLERAHALLAQRKSTQAIKILRKGLKSHPRDLRLSLRLGGIEIELKNFTRAIRILEDSLTANPGQPDLLYHLGLAHLSIGDGAAAEGYLRPIVDLHPRDVPLQEAFGACLAMQRKNHQALAVFRRALEHISDENQSRRLKLHIVVALQDCSRTEEALEVVSDLKRLAPGDTEILLAEARLQSDLGNTLEAETCLTSILAQEPGNIDAFDLLHKIPGREPDPAVLTKIETFLDDSSIDYRDEIRLNFLAGEICDKMKSFDSAFRYFKRANDRRRETNGIFDVRSHLDLVERIKSVFDGELVSRFGDRDPEVEPPIFILGMPRSGTSLAEQILAAHHAIHGVGEREELAHISGALGHRLGSERPYPDCMEELGLEVSQSLAAEYLAQVSADVLENLRVTDKMPRNFMDIGLIRVLFPDAPIIHCMRDPLDTCLSCYVSDFGLRQKFSTGFSELAEYYNAYRDLMDHWQSVLDRPVYDLQYEDLVAAPETEIPKLIDYCGLPWDENCLAPHLANRPVITASRWQVRQPIYKSSVSRSVKYAGHLDGLKSALRL